MSYNSVKNPVTLEKIISLCKRRGFIFQSADIYGGLNGIYDTGPLGVLLKNNIRSLWINTLKKFSNKIVPIEGALLGPEIMWQASGHVENFHDPLIDCLSCKKRFRADDVAVNAPCPHCGNTSWTAVRNFHLMFKTGVGATSEQNITAYLRPETAQAIFVNFKNIMLNCRMKIPFGIYQIGKAFRNEITPKQFLFRMREFEQMEIEWFCMPETSSDFFKQWIEHRLSFYTDIGISPSSIRIRPHQKDELSHYSSATSDIEYQFPFGWKELEGIAHRGNFDLSQHTKFSGKDLTVFDEATKQSFIPDIIECSVGTDRLFLTVLFDAYHEEMVEGEERIILKLHPRIAPIKAAFFPLMRQFNEPMERLHETVSSHFETQYDDSGSIGKRYRRHDEIGTPICFTYDFESENTQTVTVRHRDSMKQERISFDKVVEYIRCSQV